MFGVLFVILFRWRRCCHRYWQHIRGLVVDKMNRGNVEQNDVCLRFCPHGPRQATCKKEKKMQMNKTNKKQSKYALMSGYDLCYNVAGIVASVVTSIIAIVIN